MASTLSVAVPGQSHGHDGNTFLELTLAVIAASRSIAVLPGRVIFGTGPPPLSSTVVDMDMGSRRQSTGGGKDPVNCQSMSCFLFALALTARSPFLARAVRRDVAPRAAQVFRCVVVWAG